ncbi:deoxyribose-phosphate aldolase [Spiroplasma endosymbiont of Labia minor]|uniref:deoxyribose-phosphate aldolase n=1 Tax=Spiroplasma endosymbiont of Labia minor TaxID=3066305 RepID=UPI0030D5D63C
MKLNKYIDHTLLKADATREQIKILCEEAIKYDFATVCLNSCNISFAKEILKNSTVGITTVVGFPLGANLTEVKVEEIRQAEIHGATEFDFVMNIGFFKSGLYDEILKEFIILRASTKKIIKVIIETCLLTDEEIIKACQLAVDAKLDFVKTSTGFSTAGATVENVKLMKSVVKDKAKIKAAGGIKNIDDAKKMIDAGADRLGTSGGVTIINGEKIADNQY